MRTISRALLAVTAAISILPIIYLVGMLPQRAEASTVLNNATYTLTVPTGTAPGNQAVTLPFTAGPFDSVSAQIGWTCAKGSVTLQGSNDATNWYTLASVIVSSANALTSSNLWNGGNPYYQFLQFSAVNSSAPANSFPATVVSCTATITPCFKSSTVISN